MNRSLQRLELGAVLEALARNAESPAGAEACLELEPAYDRDTVARRLELTGLMLEAMESATGFTLAGLNDVSKPARGAAKGAGLDGVTLHRVAVSARAMRLAREWILANAQGSLAELARDLPVLSALEGRLFEALDGDGTVRDTADPELGKLRSKKADLEKRALDRIKAYTTGKDKTLLSDSIYTEREGRYVLPLKAENRGKIKGIVHDTSASGNTIYIEPQEVVEIGNRIREAEGEIRRVIERVLAELSAEVGSEVDEIEPGLGVAVAIDVLAAKARLAQTQRAMVPELRKEPFVALHNARHPLLDYERVVPLSIEVGGDDEAGAKAILITGPNTGGKTVAIKTVGLLVAMAQCGMAVPADRMSFGAFSGIWSDIGDEQSLQQSLSTFSGHIRNIASMLEGIKPGALVLLDEIGAGTDPAEGAALAVGLLRRFRELGAFVVASTHYGELKAFASNEPGFKNAAMEFDRRSLKPTYRLMLGVPGASHAMEIARRYGIPDEVVEMAKQGLGAQEHDIGRMIEELEISKKHARAAQGGAERERQEVANLRAGLEEELAAAQKARKEAKAKLREEVDEALREVRAEARELFESLKLEGGLVQDAKERLESIGSDAEEIVKPDEPQAKTQTTGEWERGQTVKVEGYDRVGTIEELPKNGKATVRIGIVKLQVETEEMTPVEAAAEPPRQGKRPVTASVEHELTIRMMRAEEAQTKLDDYLDRAILSGRRSIRIVHGKGSGTLKAMTHRTLKATKGVARFRLGGDGEGGEGVTIAELE